MFIGRTRDELVPLLKARYPDFNGGSSTVGRLMDHWYPAVIPWYWEMRGTKQVKVTNLSVPAIKALIDHRDELVKGRLRARTEKQNVRAPREALLHAAGRDFSALYHEIMREEPVGLYGRVEKNR